MRPVGVERPTVIQFECIHQSRDSLRQITRIGLLCLIGCAPGFTVSQVITASADKTTSAFYDPSPHRVQMVTVDRDVQLEVLDWGGTGRPIVLLAGSGNTAHIYDGFAPKLSETYHVYGITRRGYGASSSPTSGYSVRLQGDDILAVSAALKINRPVLVGHSFAGQELSSLATRFPDKIAGAVYLDAAYGYAFYAPLFGELAFDLPELQDKLEQLSRTQDDAALIDKLLQLDLPRFERDLQRKKLFAELISQVPADRSGPSAADRASFAALSAWYAQNMVGGNPPEVELHLSFESNP